MAGFLLFLTVALIVLGATVACEDCRNDEGKGDATREKNQTSVNSGAPHAIYNNTVHNGHVLFCQSGPCIQVDSSDHEEEPKVG